MTPSEAVDVLDAAAAVAHMTREDHSRVIIATRTLREHLAVLAVKKED